MVKEVLHLEAGGFVYVIHGPTIIAGFVGPATVIIATGTETTSPVPGTIGKRFMPRMRTELIFGFFGPALSG